MAKAQTAEPADNPLTAKHWIYISLMGAGLFIAACLLIYLLVCLWPVPAAGETASGNESVETTRGAWASEAEIFGRTITVLPEVRLVLLVTLTGALGAFVHIAQSFSDFVGNRRFRASWVWWYILKLPVGATLALIVYAVFRGGFVSIGADAQSNLNVFGVIAVAGLVGMFSQQAADKLREIFQAMLNLNRPPERKDKLDEDEQKKE